MNRKDDACHDTACRFHMKLWRPLGCNTVSPRIVRFAYFLKSAHLAACLCACLQLWYDNARVLSGGGIFTIQYDRTVSSWRRRLHRRRRRPPTRSRRTAGESSWLDLADLGNGGTATPTPSTTSSRLPSEPHEWMIKRAVQSPTILSPKPSRAAAHTVWCEQRGRNAHERSLR